ncbi:cupin [Asticcacaulis sp. AC460]|uniref:cupin domain-containing protein n=1 Tax=Asticcacaulis sp. AC460 TaxID=1282360 RepID=UPI0003C3D37E|nr:cupin domain-containing protein [Asticcacaulis sp. AC460]ESQ87362.1 cupin [Asticcacaulis sp. AC460]
MSHFVRFDREDLPPPETSAPPPEKVVAGDPRFTLWTLDANMDETRFAGYWASTPGTWRVSYDEWEYCTLVEGHAIVKEDGKEPVHLHPGDHFIFRPGYSGQWQVIEPVLKTFVVLV